ncbi:hypothetical protein [Persicobacter psychrovividus]|uniref:hypothetical protein n=1 Tax=Persicobacter psychrovividus TaxID=387638 RepID=UPI0030CA4345
MTHKKAPDLLNINRAKSKFGNKLLAIGGIFTESKGAGLLFPDALKTGLNPSAAENIPESFKNSFLFIVVEKIINNDYKFAHSFAPFWGFIITKWRYIIHIQAAKAGRATLIQNRYPLSL